MSDMSTLFRRYNGDVTKAPRRRGLSSEADTDIAHETFLHVLALGARSEAVVDNPRGYLGASWNLPEILR